MDLETEAPVETSQPDWFGEMAEEEPPAEAAGMPDWMGGTDLESEAPVETSQPDWFREMAEEEPPAEAAGMPDWMSDMDMESEAPADTSQPDWFGELAEEEPAAEAAGMPDWMGGIDLETEAPAAETSPVLDWMADIDEEIETKAGFVPKDDLVELYEESAPADVDEYTRWVGGLAQDVEASEETSEMDVFISGLAQDVSSEFEEETQLAIEESLIKEPPSQIPEWGSEQEDEPVSYKKDTSLLGAPETPAWLLSLGDEEEDMAPVPPFVPTEVAEADQIADNYTEVPARTEEEALGEFTFSYDFEDVRPAWMRDTDEDSQTGTFTPPWLRD
jgi:hypothetical protein